MMTDRRKRKELAETNALPLPPGTSTMWRMSHAADLLAPPLLGALLGPVNRLPAHPPSELERVRRGGIPPIFAAHPALAERVPWRPLGDFPTPVEEVAPDVAGPGAARLFVKREDLSSAIYGGNKVRKLEHFVADAEIRGADGLLTLGAIGSNHALA